MFRCRGGRSLTTRSPIAISRNGRPIAVLMSFEDYRESQDQAAPVTGFAEAPLQPANADVGQSLSSFVGSAKGAYASPEEAVDFIRQLRDEWE